VDELTAEYKLIMMSAKVVFKGTSWIWGITQPEKYNELKGIVKGVNSKKLDLPLAVLLNSINELRAWCTSIVASQKDGTVIHSRNMDWLPLAFDLMFNAKFQKGGKDVFEGVVIAGTTGVYTGKKASGAFAISNNSRRTSNNTHIPQLFQNLIMEFQGYGESGYLIRDALTNCEDYKCAYEYLRDTE